MHANANKIIQRQKTLSLKHKFAKNVLNTIVKDNALRKMEKKLFANNAKKILMSKQIANSVYKGTILIQNQVYVRNA